MLEREVHFGKDQYFALSHAPEQHDFLAAGVHVDFLSGADLDAADPFFVDNGAAATRARAARTQRAEAPTVWVPVSRGGLWTMQQIR